MNTDERRYNGKCKCGSKFSVLAGQRNFSVGPIAVFGHPYVEYASATRVFPAYSNDSYLLLWACECGKKNTAKPVIGKYRADKKCDGRCLSATGHSCECQCGGRNHGAGC